MDAQPPDNQPHMHPHYEDVHIPTHKRGIEAYAIWFAQQPIETQRNLIAQGLAPEAREGDGNYTFEVKPDHRAFSYEEEPATETEPIEQRTYTEDEVQEVVRRVVMAMQLSESPDCLFQARCILIAFGIGDPPTETELAKQRDCSRQFVSKKVKRIQQLFNLAPSQYMRSEAACKAYADAWQRNQSKRSHKSHRAKHPPTPSSTHIKLQAQKTTPAPPPPRKESIFKSPPSAGS
jgi:hypothetical protein